MGTVEDIIRLLDLLEELEEEETEARIETARVTEALEQANRE